MTILLASALLSVVTTTSAARPNHPVLLGVDGCFLPARPGFDPWTSDPYWRAVKSLGITLYVAHLDPQPTADATAALVRRIDAAMRKHGLVYTLNNEHANWVKTVELTPGVNEYAHPDGTHRWDLRREWLDAVLPAGRTGKAALLGVTYDETEHMQLTSHQFATSPGGDPLDAPQIAVTDGLGMVEAYERLVAGCERIRKHYGRALRPFTEQVWPDLFHIYARAGWTIAPKVLKENFSSVVLSTALGAALQYRSRGAALWVTPDLWGRAGYPGHSPRELRSALLMGYWLGADALYVENLDYQGYTSRHPEADPTGSLLRLKDDGSLEVTKYGQVVQDFYRDYVPAHPRRIDWRQYRPRVAIVRLPDGAWGQRGTAFRDRLLGNKQHPMDEASAEWLDVWPILTHGAVRPGAISMNNGRVYPETLWPFFIPIDSVAVFDHRVRGPVLDGVECFVVCGHALSAETFGDIRGRVGNGATCVIARRLYRDHARGPLPGKWVVVDDFRSPAVADALKPFLGPPDVARFRFRDSTVEFRAPVDRDVLEVSVRPR